VAAVANAVRKLASVRSLSNIVSSGLAVTVFYTNFECSRHGYQAPFRRRKWSGIVTVLRKELDPLEYGLQLPTYRIPYELRIMEYGNIEPGCEDQSDYPNDPPFSTDAR
jgi:hypothetical protein